MAELLTPEDWTVLAWRHLGDAQLLRDAGRWAGAYLFAGYAVEHALKRRIMRVRGLAVWPPRAGNRLLYTHNLRVLAELGCLQPALAVADPSLSDALSTAVSWTDGTRYEAKPVAEGRARAVVGAAREEGLVAWISQLA